MKKIISLLAAIFIISSCSTKIGLIKRKYNKGFYVSQTKHKRTKEQVNTVAHVKHKSVKLKSDSSIPANFYHQQKNKLVNEQNCETQIISKQEEIQSNKFVQKNVIQSKIMKLKAQSHNTTKKLIAGALSFKKSEKMFVGKNEFVKTKSGADTNTLILVILSLFPFICLIAVYLKDGKSITTNFWVDLLLHLTIIGEIIYALLVVLDIFSLT